MQTSQPMSPEHEALMREASRLLEMPEDEVLEMAAEEADLLDEVPEVDSKQLARWILENEHKLSTG